MSSRPLLRPRGALLLLVVASLGLLACPSHAHGHHGHVHPHVHDGPSLAAAAARAHWPPYGRNLRSDAAASSSTATSNTVTLSPAVTMTSLSPPTTRCSVPLPQTMRRNSTGNSATQPQNMSPDKVTAFIAAASPKYVDPRFATHYCIDGRHTSGSVHTPGGDFSEFLLALAAYQSVTGVALTEDQVYGAMTAFVDAYAIPVERPFYMHTDAASDAYMRTAARVSSSYSFEAPPAADRANLLNVAVDPGTLGCSHVRRTLQNPDVYQTPAALTQAAIRAFYRALWRDRDAGTSAVQLLVLQGTASEGAAVVVQGESCGDSVLSFTPNGSGGTVQGQVMLYHPDGLAFIRQTLSRFLCDLKPGAPSAACTPSGVRAAMGRIFAPGLASTMAVLAADRPVDILTQSANAFYAGVRTTTPEPPDSSTTAAAAADASYGGSNGCAVTDVTAALQQASTETDATKLWRILSPDHAKAMASKSPTSVPIEARTWSCIDGRSTKAILGTPGGTISEFLLSLAALVKAGVTIPSEDDVQALLDSYAQAYAIPYYRQVYMHTDSHSVDAMAAKLGVAALDLNSPPASLRTRILAMALDPAYIGCGHLRLTLANPSTYGIDSTIVAWTIRSFLRALWSNQQRGAGRFILEVLAGDHLEGAVLLVQSAGCDGKTSMVTPQQQPFWPGVAPQFGSGEAFVFHYVDVLKLREWNSNFFAGTVAPRLAPSPTPAPTVADMLASIDTVFRPQLAATVAALASTLPQYTDTFSSNADPDVLVAVAADAARSGGIEDTLKLPFELQFTQMLCSGFTMANFRSFKFGLSYVLGIPDARILLRKLRCATPPTRRWWSRWLLEDATLTTAMGVDVLSPTNVGTDNVTLAQAAATLKGLVIQNNVIRLPTGEYAKVVYPSDVAAATTTTTASTSKDIAVSAWLIPAIFVGIAAVVIVALGLVKRQQHRKEVAAAAAEAGGKRLGAPGPLDPDAPTKYATPAYGPPPPAGYPPYGPPYGPSDNFKPIDVDLDGYGPQPPRVPTPRPGTPRLPTPRPGTPRGVPGGYV